MKVYGKCKSCSHEIAYRTNAHTRVEFAMQDGEIKKLNCKNCGTNTEFHVDKLYAIPSKRTQIIAGLTFLFGIPVILILLNVIYYNSEYYIIGGFFVPLVVFIILNRQDQTRVNDFNRRKLKGRVHNIG